jgi:FtsZ-interacting cell division protein ZipA
VSYLLGGVAGAAVLALIAFAWEAFWSSRREGSAETKDATDVATIAKLKLDAATDATTIAKLHGQIAANEQQHTNELISAQHMIDGLREELRKLVAANPSLKVQAGNLESDPGGTAT